MGSCISRQRKKSRETSNVFLVDSDGQLVEGEAHGLPSFEAFLLSLAETPAMCMCAAMSASVSLPLSPAGQEFFRKMEKAYAKRELERQRRKAMRRAGALDKTLPKAAPSKPRARF